MADVLRSPIQREVGVSETQSLLDRVHERLLDQAQAVDESMTELMSGLWALRSAATPELWKQVVGQCVAHPLRQVIHQDPFSARSFNKPRGYAGDAVLIDYIYSGNCTAEEQDQLTPLGEHIFRFNCKTPACAAVRTRRDLVAAIIDQVCSLKDRPRILSVACGHLREAKLCRSVSGGQAGRFVALDQDERSIGVVDQELADYGVVPVCNSIKALFRGDIAREKFDFIYSTGLYDYLDERLATKLTTRMFEMLNPGGRLLVANFLPDIWGAGYMESFMDWHLIYRTPVQMDALASDIPESDLATRATFTERNTNIVFLDLTRK